jgi:hypothetical protein
MDLGAVAVKACAFYNQKRYSGFAGLARHSSFPGLQSFQGFAAGRFRMFSVLVSDPGAVTGFRVAEDSATSTGL